MIALSDCVGGKGLIGLLVALALLQVQPPSRGDDPYVPDALVPWKEWVLREVEHRQSPKLHTDGQTPIDFWPSRLSLATDANGGSFSLEVEVFDRCWVPLPGSTRVWPIDVKADDGEIVVIDRENRPSVELAPGKHKIVGRFQWASIPEKISVPEQIGVLTLTVDGEVNSQPTWDAGGEVWLKRDRSEVADKDGISLQIYRLLEDGIPIWLRTEIELTVSGKSREEEIGWVMPEGWRLSTVESPIPVAVDDRGVMKAQVRAGKWTVRINAFRARETREIQFAADANAAVPTELIGFRANPQFRIAQIEGLPSIDVTQTSFPDYWKPFPVYLWDTSKPFQLLERMRGMGDSNPSGLTINRKLWLDEDGTALTYEDNITGQAQRIWRLDVADQHYLGAVRVDGTGQLITENPETGQSGVEIRQRNLNLSAVGRVERSGALSATGWKANADSLQVTLTLPPGWRVLAIFGADSVDGDWLTAWSLLDLFLLLVFSFAVFRLSGIVAGAIALLAFALSYHEAGAPRFLWLILLVPLALETVVPPGRVLRLIKIAKYSVLTILLLILLPFIASQVQSVLYPQLEVSGQMYVQPSEVMSRTASTAAEYSDSVADYPMERSQSSPQVFESKIVNQNMINDPRAVIQTGPAKPRWEWNSVTCYWSGPVGEYQAIRPVLISLTQHRFLTVARVLLLMALLVAVLVRRKRGRPEQNNAPSSLSTGATAGLLLMLCLGPATAHAQFPDKEMLESLREELLELPNAFPNAAQMPTASLTIEGDRIVVTCEIHAAAKCAVPLPGRLPTWSPVTVKLDDQENIPIVRRDGYMWVMVNEGVHKVVMEGRLFDQSDWEWTYLLAPKFVTIDAPGWKVNGVRPDGTPERQILLTREQAVTPDAAAYDRTQFSSIVMFDRYLEIGILSKVRTVVSRIGDNRRAISLTIPLIPGERVLTANQEVVDGQITVRLSTNDDSYAWDSELPSGADVMLTAPSTDQWVERWHLNTSPVWNVSLSGLEPVFETQSKELVPVWHPWPGESATIQFKRPVAIPGEIITVQAVEHAMDLGDRRQNTTLTIDLECSVATDFPIDVGLDAVVTDLTIDKISMPVQRRDALLVIPTKAGNQQVVVKWYVEQALGFRANMGRVVLPAIASNVNTTMQVPESRWVLWTSGPQRGPAVRFWTILIVALLIALGLSLLPRSPLRLWEWMLLAIGLTQVPVYAGMFVAAWLFLIAFRGSNDVNRMKPLMFNGLQVTLVMMTAISMLILIYVVSAGLLGSPKMFILGNGSYQQLLRWFAPRTDGALPEAGMTSVSVWFYRLAMLAWALWLATSLIRWLANGWQQFSKDGFWRSSPPPIQVKRVDPNTSSQP